MTKFCDFVQKAQAVLTTQILWYNIKEYYVICFVSRQLTYAVVRLDANRTHFRVYDLAQLPQY